MSHRGRYDLVHEDFGADFVETCHVLLLALVWLLFLILPVTHPDDHPQLLQKQDLVRLWNVVQGNGISWTEKDEFGERVVEPVSKKASVDFCESLPFCCCQLHLSRHQKSHNLRSSHFLPNNHDLQSSEPDPLKLILMHSRDFDHGNSS